MIWIPFCAYLWYLTHKAAECSTNIQCLKRNSRHKPCRKGFQIEKLLSVFLGIGEFNSSFLKILTILTQMVMEDWSSTPPVKPSLIVGSKANSWYLALSLSLKVTAQ